MVGLSSRRSLGAFGAWSLAAAVLGSQALAVSSALACSLAEPTVFVVDPTLRGEDSIAPGTFTSVTATVTRSPKESCRGGQCRSTSCGEFASVALTFAMPPGVGSETLGYRLLWQRGDVPAGASHVLSEIWPLEAPDQDGMGRIGFTIGYDEVEDLDAQITIVAVDRAGNESAPSEPVHLEFSGCTIDLFTGSCEAAATCTATDPGRDHWPNGYIVGAAVLWVLGFVLRQRRKRPSTSAPDLAPR